MPFIQCCKKKCNPLVCTIDRLILDTRSLIYVQRMANNMTSFSMGKHSYLNEDQKDVKD